MCGENSAGRKSSKEVGFERQICNQYGNKIEKAEE
jgi:hypothetical protein